MEKKVEYPQFSFGGIRANHRAFPIGKNLRVFGADTETYKGEPHTFQAYDGSDLLFKYVRPSTIFDSFIDYVEPRCRVRGVNIVYFHYLRFDMPVLFFEKRLAMYEQISEIKFDYKGWECELLFGKVNKATLRRNGLTFHIFDSWAFTQAGLAASLDMYKIPHPKQEKSPALEKVLGNQRFDELKPGDPLRLEFESYAKQDAKSEYHLAVSIMQYHKKYLVRPSISLPQFAARVFRHHFFKPDEVIVSPPDQVQEGSLLSYHGGKNGFYLDKPSVVDHAYEIDISSAFPHAMAVLPQFIKGYYARIKDFDSKNVGIYKITGRDRGFYPLIFDHGFRPIRGEFKDVWVTSHELKRAIKSDDVDFQIEDGWVWVSDRAHKHNPLKEYVDHFYNLKQKTPKEDANYYFYKTMMNGLYGKFAQAVEVRTLESSGKLKDDKIDPKDIACEYRWDDALKKFVRIKSVWKAGQMTNFFIASQITGYVRGVLYDLETKYQAFHSATDAIKTTKKVPSVAGLGGLKIETFGRCYVFRNKLYLHFAENFDHCGHKAEKIKFWEDGQHLCKYGLHGFKGDVEDLFKARHKLLKGESYDYTYDHMVGLREGFRRGEAPCYMVPRKETLTLIQT